MFFSQPPIRSGVLATFLSLSLSIIFFIPSFCLAHRVNIFAWTENDHIIVECNYGKCKVAKNAAITVLDSKTGQKLLEGNTDNLGRFQFPAPEALQNGNDLNIVVNSGEGHRNEWKINATELNTSGYNKQENNTMLQTPTTVKNQTSFTQEALPIQPLTAEQTRSIVIQAVDPLIAPIKRDLAALKSEEPKFTNIIGGIGWIIGLTGIFLYFKSRKS